MRDRAERILQDWACVMPNEAHPSVQQRIVGDVKGLAGDVLWLLARVDALETALATVARQDEFMLVWEVDCSCNLCEQDRHVARCLGRTHSTQGVPVDLAPPSWMTADEAAQWYEARAARETGGGQ